MKNQSEKIYGIETRKVFCRSDREDRVTRVIGTIDYFLNQYFGYTLECGRSWNNKIKHKSDIKTIKSLVTNLQKSYGETEAACYDRTYVNEVRPTEEEIKLWFEKHPKKEMPAVLVNVIITSEPINEEEHECIVCGNLIAESDDELCESCEREEKRENKMSQEDWDDREEQDAFDRECNG